MLKIGPVKLDAHSSFIPPYLFLPCHRSQRSPVPDPSICGACLGVRRRGKEAESTLKKVELKTRDALCASASAAVLFTVERRGACAGYRQFACHGIAVIRVVCRPHAEALPYSVSQQTHKLSPG